MAREGLMDDCGFEFEPSSAEEQAWNDGYEQGKSDTINMYVDRITNTYKRGKKDGINEVIEKLKSDLLAHSDSFEHCLELDVLNWLNSYKEE